jgi:predicted O-methyltransferase YrrM
MAGVPRAGGSGHFAAVRAALALIRLLMASAAPQYLPPRRRSSRISAHTRVVKTEESRNRIRDVRRQLVQNGPLRSRSQERDFETVSLPERDCDLLRDQLVRAGVETVVEVGLAYGSSALAIGEALAIIDPQNPRHLIIDPFQQQVWSNVGWDLLRRAGIDSTATLMQAPSSVVLPQLLADGLMADAAFVDGSHRFHEVFMDLYYLRKIVRPGGLIVVDDDWTPSVRTAVRYYEKNLAWEAIPDAFTTGTHRAIGDNPAAESVPRCRALRLPGTLAEPPFEAFRPF